MIALQFGGTEHEIVDDCLNDIRVFIQKKIKITPGDSENVEIIFPVLLAPTPTKKAPLMYGDKSTKNKKETILDDEEEPTAVTAT
jgi:hypothetical protein